MKLNEAKLFFLVLSLSFTFATEAPEEHRIEKEVSIAFQSSPKLDNHSKTSDKEVSVRIGVSLDGFLDKVKGFVKPITNIFCGDGLNTKNCTQNKSAQPIKEDKESPGILRFFGGLVDAVVDDIERVAKPIYPGTQWCGAGDRARSVADLGLFELTDNCCREHDNCPENIPPGETRNGLENNGVFTLSHCDCDDKFYSCLKEAGTVIARKIGRTYFNVLRPQCFRYDYPIVRCAYSRGILRRRCTSYIMNATAEKTWQWFDNKRF